MLATGKVKRPIDSFISMGSFRRGHSSFAGLERRGAISLSQDGLFTGEDNPGVSYREELGAVGVFATAIFLGNHGYDVRICPKGSKFDILACKGGVSRKIEVKTWLVSWSKVSSQGKDRLVYGRGADILVLLGPQHWKLVREDCRGKIDLVPGVIEREWLDDVLTIITEAKNCLKRVPS
jgi:hypothetical protein